MKRRGLALVAALCALSLVALAPAASASTAYSFNLHTPNTAVNPGTGDIIRVTGGGTFDTNAQAPAATGSVPPPTPKGAPLPRGALGATRFGQFYGFRRPQHHAPGGGDP